MEIFFVAILLAFIPAFIAHNKGRTFFLWWLYGVAFFIFALIHSLLLEKKIAYEENNKKAIDTESEKNV